MANGKDLFQERLKRLEKTQSPTPLPVQAVEVAPEPRVSKPQKGEGSSVILGAVALMVLILGGGAFATMAFAPELIFSTEVLTEFE
jgi:hypothetical protein